MSQDPYNWKRFWCPRGSIFYLSDDGYMTDPESEWGKYTQPNIVSFNEIESTPCLILLGEPGLGKTTVMEQSYAEISKSVNENSVDTQWINLGAYQTDVAIRDAIFGTSKFKKWLSGQYQLHLFIDSMDECLLRVNSIARYLIEELKNYPIQRLTLRVACRTAEWPNGLETGCNSLWGEENVRIYELVPLRRVDVQNAAITVGIEYEPFLEEIKAKQVESLAIKPITLRFLLNKYKRDHQLPYRQAELYTEGCRLLCEEASQSRREAGLLGDLTSDQRLMTAARMCWG